jgi:gamma-glutamylaminecyclotransferase
MDKLERISAPDGYRRIKITVLAKDSGEEFVVFTYARPVEQIKGADIRKELTGEYNIEHAVRYRSRNP